MGALQQRALPRSSSQPKTGRLSNARIGAPQLVQWEAGKATLSPRGKRWMTTFKKLPKTRPSETPTLIQNQGGSSKTVTRRQITPAFADDYTRQLGGWFDWTATPTSPTVDPALRCG